MLLPLEADDNDPALCPLIMGPPAANIGHPLPETLSIAEAKPCHSRNWTRDALSHTSVISNN